MIRHIFTVVLAGLLIAGCSSSTNQKEQVFEPIKTVVPQRPAGQQDVLQLTAPKLEIVRVGFVGLGMRGPGAVERFTHIPGTQVVALCDVIPENVEKCQEILRKAGQPEAVAYSGDTEIYKQLCERDDIDLVYIATDWIHHVPVALYAMEHGKHAAIEVPSATSLEDIWKLIDTSERTRKHCIQLENCCYDFFELTALNMAQQGVFGEILHAEGAYLHNLDPYWDEYWNNWRMDFNRTHRGDVYPTHGFGPVCQALNIHRGDQLQTLVAMDTKAVNGPAYIKKTTGETVTDFKNGDQTTTMIKTKNGATILIEHGVMTPRPYSRMYQLVGTKGYAGKYPTQQFCVMPDMVDRSLLPEKFDERYEVVIGGDLKDKMMEAYRSPILTKDLEETAKTVGGHGGMDFIMDYRLVYCLHNGLPLDMDVYDLAEWCCVAELSAISMDNGCVPVEIPDFTRGGQDKIKGFSYAFAE